MITDQHWKKNSENELLKSDNPQYEIPYGRLSSEESFLLFSGVLFLKIL